MPEPSLVAGRPHLLGWSALGICMVLMLLRAATLPMYPLTDRTESRYGEIARAMATDGDWVTPRLQGEPFWGKPPLATWAQAAGIFVLGPTEFATRLPAWLAALLTLLVVWRTGVALAGPTAGIASAVVFASMPLTLFMAGAVMTDPFLVLGTAVSMYGILASTGDHAPHHSARRSPWRVAAIVAVGLAIASLAKGPVGLVFGGAPFLAMTLFPEGRRRLSAWPWVRCLVLLGLLVLPWYIAAEVRTPGFLRYFLVGEHVERFLNPSWSGDLYGGTHPRPRGTIWLYLLLGVGPWVPAMLSALWQGCRGGRLRSLPARPRYVALGVACLLPLALFTLAGSILPTYVYPVLPALCVLIGAHLANSGLVSRARWRNFLRTPQLVAFTMCVIVPALAFVPDTVWDGATQRRILKDVDADVVIYGRPITTLYSASFYSRGTAIGVEDAKDANWDRARVKGVSVVVVTKNFDFRQVPKDLRLRLTLVDQGHAAYQIWRLRPDALNR